MIRFPFPKTDADRAYRNTAGTRWAMIAVGCVLMLISPIIGAIPGPGFIIVFPIGLALVLRNSIWAKRAYVGFKCRFPEYGNWTDWALRRRRSRTLPRLPRFLDVLRRSVGRQSRKAPTTLIPGAKRSQTD